MRYNTREQSTYQRMLLAQQSWVIANNKKKKICDYVVDYSTLQHIQKNPFDSIFIYFLYQKQYWRGEFNCFFVTKDISGCINDFRMNLCAVDCDMKNKYVWAIIPIVFLNLF